MRLSRDPDTKVETLRATCCISALDIAEISPWVIEGKEKIDVVLRTAWYEENGTFKEAVGYTFHDAVCYDYWEEFDKEQEKPCLWFCLQAEAITRSNSDEETALKKLLE